MSSNSFYITTNPILYYLTQVTKLNNITKNLLRKLEVTEKQLREIKNQYHSSQDDNTEFRQNLLKVNCTIIDYNSGYYKAANSFKIFKAHYILGLGRKN